MRLRPDAARPRFVAARVARLATVDAAGAPHVVPVTFAVVDDCIVVAVDHKPKRHGRLRRLDNIAGEPRAAFLVDEYDEDWSLLWWVRADTVATVLDAASVSERTRALDALAAKYPQYANRRPTGATVSAQVRQWSGWSAS
jgi:PPOX class probable F420-dependent enzyme